MQQNNSLIHKEANIGENVKIGPFCYIEKDVTIGDNTIIGPNVSISNGTIIGSGCKIFTGAALGGDSQDLKYNGEKSYAIIEDNVIVREFVTVNRSSSENSITRVKQNSLLMAYSHVAHDCIVGENCVVANSVQLGGHVELGDWAIIGGLSGVHQFVKIGPHVMVSGATMVRMDIPPYIKAGREPVSYSGVNSIGLKRRGFDQKKIDEIKDIYRILYVKGYSRKKALDYVMKNIPNSEEKRNIIDFINNSKRGIIKGLK